MKHALIALLLIAGTILTTEPQQYALRSHGRIYSRGTGTHTVTPPPTPGGPFITINGVNLTINGNTVNAH